jgi:hypothetical protein
MKRFLTWGTLVHLCALYFSDDFRMIDDIPKKTLFAPIGNTQMKSTANNVGPRSSQILLSFNSHTKQPNTELIPLDSISDSDSLDSTHYIWHYPIHETNRIVPPNTPASEAFSPAANSYFQTIVQYPFRLAGYIWESAKEEKDRTTHQLHYREHQIKDQIIKTARVTMNSAQKMKDSLAHSMKESEHILGQGVDKTHELLDETKKEINAKTEAGSEWLKQKAKGSYRTLKESVGESEEKAADLLHTLMKSLRSMEDMVTQLPPQIEESAMKAFQNVHLWNEPKHPSTFEEESEHEKLLDRSKLWKSGDTELFATKSLLQAIRDIKFLQEKSRKAVSNSHELEVLSHDTMKQMLELNKYLQSPHFSEDMRGHQPFSSDMKFATPRKESAKASQHRSSSISNGHKGYVPSSRPLIIKDIPSSSQSRSPAAQETLHPRPSPSFYERAEPPTFPLPISFLTALLLGLFYLILFQKLYYHRSKSSIWKGNGLSELRQAISVRHYHAGANSSEKFSTEPVPSLSSTPHDFNLVEMVGYNLKNLLRILISTCHNGFLL